MIKDLTLKTEEQHLDKYILTKHQVFFLKRLLEDIKCEFGEGDVYYDEASSALEMLKPLEIYHGKG